MYRRLLIVSVIIFTALTAFGILGFHSINLHAEGLQGKRIVEFSEVAEQIRIDVKQKLDKFIQQEQKRPYTDYQYIYTPESFNNYGNATLRSPLAEKMSHGMAYGHFQIEPSGKIISPFYAEGLNQKLDTEKQAYVSNLTDNIAKSLKGNANSSAYFDIQRKTLVKNIIEKQNTYDKVISSFKRTKNSNSKKESAQNTQRQLSNPRRSNYIVNTWQVEEKQKPQIITQSRNFVDLNISNNIATSNDAMMYEQNEQTFNSMRSNRSRYRQARSKTSPKIATKDLNEIADNSDKFDEFMGYGMAPLSQKPDDIVQIRIEPFVPITVKAGVSNDSLFQSQVFLLRHIQIEDNHFIQGFKLNESELIAQIKESATNLLRSGMGFELGKNELPDATHTAILDFGFGQVMLNLIELKPQWIANQVSQLKNWYFAIVTVVLLATLLALVSLWRNLNTQVKLARKKDDFISAVSHELRTPLTTIRMYTEMLEKNWVKTDEKRTEYYSTMRQESERLTRLIENVLDFSRIQRGKKRYNFAIGNINTCINEIVEMMTPCAAQQNFQIKTDLQANLQNTSFDSDAVMQIVINLIDNALKYAAAATDKTITVTTRTDRQYILIEVADCGPGIPHTQRKKIFDEFYRIGDESKRETTGTGLGLALVKKFADAHKGFVEALPAKPNGAILRVAISTTQIQ